MISDPLNSSDSVVELFPSTLDARRSQHRRSGAERQFVQEAVRFRKPGELSSREKKALAEQVADCLIQLAEEGLGRIITNRQKLRYDLKKPIEAMSRLAEVQQDFELVRHQLAQEDQQLWRAAFIAAMQRHPALCWALEETDAVALLALVPEAPPERPQLRIVENGEG